ncbi:MAG: NAD(P)/FAD-dependent oxidoreductase [Desulfobaccales bacterium]
MAEEKRGVLIIGGSSAAMSAVEAVRSRDTGTPITIISKEKCLPYTPTILPYLIKNKISGGNLFFRRESFYKDNNIELILGEEVVRINPEDRSVFTKSRRSFSFGKLLIASGAFPVKLPLSGAEDERVVSLRTIEDAEKIKSLARLGKKATILGSGLVGMQLAEIFCENGLQVVVIEAEGQILPRNFDIPCATAIEGIFTARGVEISTSRRAVSLEPAKDHISVCLDDGRVVDSDFVISAVGTRPVIKLTAGSGIACNQGILVDDSMRTSCPDIYAAGDVAEASGFFGEGKILNQLLPDAVEQGRIAGLNISGADVTYTGGISMTTFNFFESTSFSIGNLYDAPSASSVYLDSSPERRSYGKLVFDRESRLTGALFLNAKVSITLLANYIRRRIAYPGNKKNIPSDFETFLKEFLAQV